jgi:methanogenic corrinoid protein MtbC1
VGGEPMTPHFAKEVGADGYAPDAREAAALVWQLTRP